MDDDGPNSALEAFKALYNPERKAAEELLLTDGLRKAEQRKMRQYGHLFKVGWLHGGTILSKICYSGDRTMRVKWKSIT